MTTKEYNAIADAIQEIRTGTPGIPISTQEEEGLIQRYTDKVARRITDTLEALDKAKFPHIFDRKKFLAACEPEETKPNPFYGGSPVPKGGGNV